MPCTKSGSVSTSKNRFDRARDTSLPWASTITVSSRPLSQIEETWLGPHGITSTQPAAHGDGDRKSTRLNSSHTVISYAVFCLKKKNTKTYPDIGALTIRMHTVR